MLYVFIRKRVIEISTEFFVIKLNSKMCAFSALYEGIGSKQTVQYLHRKKNQDFDQCVRCKYCTVAGGGDIILWYDTIYINALQGEPNDNKNHDHIQICFWRYEGNIEEMRTMP